MTLLTIYSIDNIELSTNIDFDAIKVIYSHAKQRNPYPSIGKQ